MLTLELAVLLAALGVASFPCWRHSRHWGYLPCSTAAGLLLLVALAAASGRPTAGNPAVEKVAAPPPIAQPARPPRHPDFIDS